MPKCIFCNKEFEHLHYFQLPVSDEDVEVLMQICPECLSKLCNALRGWSW